MDTLKKIIAEAFKYKYISESAVEWIGGHPWDDDLFHKNAEKFGLSVEQEFISVRGKSLEFDYVVLNTPTVFYHATPKENVEKIKKEGLLLSNSAEQSRGKYVVGVFLSGSSEGISRWRGDNTAVLKIILPRGTKVYQDRQSNAVFVRENIPSKFISVN